MKTDIDQQNYSVDVKKERNFQKFILGFYAVVIIYLSLLAL